MMCALIVADLVQRRWQLDDRQMAGSSAGRPAPAWKTTAARSWSLAALALVATACDRGHRSFDDAAPTDARPRADAATDPDAAIGADAPPPVDAPPPPDFVEPPGNDDPFLGGAPVDTGIVIAANQTRTIEGTIEPGGDPPWADSDGFRFQVGADTTVRAELIWTGDGAMRSLAIHRLDHRFVAWSGMSTEGRALTHPTALAAGDYFVHVAAETGAHAGSYRLVLTAGDLGACTTAAVAYTEVGTAGRANDAAAVTWDTFPSTMPATGVAEPTGLTIAVGGRAAIAGNSAALAADGDSYLDRDGFAFAAGPDTREVRVLLESVSPDVNLDVFAFAADAGRLVGTGVEVSVIVGAPEVAAIPVEPGRTYWLWIGARDERANGGDHALPLAYRATLCGFGGAP